MIELTRRRELLGLSKQQLSFASRVPAGVIGQAESGRFIPYRPQLERLAAALEFAGDPDDLLKPVVDDQTAA